jgi:hypothetical protein
LTNFNPHDIINVSNEREVLKMNNMTLTIKRDINVDIDKLTEAYEELMEDALLDMLKNLGLSFDDADYIWTDEDLSEKVLNLVKIAMAKKFL